MRKEKYFTYVTFIIGTNVKSSLTVIMCWGDGISGFPTIILEVRHRSPKQFTVSGGAVVHEPFAASWVQVIAEVLASLGIIDGTDFLI